MAEAEIPAVEYIPPKLECMIDDAIRDLFDAGTGAVRNPNDVMRNAIDVLVKARAELARRPNQS